MQETKRLSYKVVWEASDTAKTIHTILNLRDKMSQKLKVVSKNLLGTGKDAERARKKVSNFAVSSGDKIGKLTGKCLKFGAVAGAALGGAALTKGLQEGINLEGFRAQLETATKDTKKAGDIMTYAINLANKTPFEGGQLVDAAAKFEAMGMSAKKWLTYTGDMAGATNKDFDQATEALIDAQAGELERLKEFGITKTMITKKANQLYKNEEIVNSKGQIVDQKKFNESLLALMEDKFTGGMKKQAKTLKGTWSTVTGVTKSALAEMVGMGADGVVKSGSVLDTLKKKAGELAGKLQQMQADGTITELSQKVTKSIHTIVKAAKKAISFVSDNKKTITAIAKVAAAVGGFVLVTGKTAKTVNKVSKAMKKTKEAINTAKAAFPGLAAAGEKAGKKLQSTAKKAGSGTLKTAKKTGTGIVSVMKKAGNGVLKAGKKISKGFGSIVKKIKPLLTPKNIGIALIIGAIIALAVIIYKNWDKIKPVVDMVIAKVKEIWKNVKEFFGKIGTVIGETVGKIGAKVKEIGASIKGFFTGIGDTIKNAVSGVFDWFTEKIDKVKGAVTWVVNKVTGKGKEQGANANGTRYWKGGKTAINEHGPEVVDLPSGTRIYPANTSKKMQKGETKVEVHVTVQGNVIGDDKYADELGNRVAKKIVLALGNV